MLFCILCTDRPGQGALRAATREAHLAYLRGQGAALMHGGPLLNEEGAPTGSLILIDAADRAAAQALADADPYKLAGLFESVSISAHRAVFRDGRLVG